MNVMIFYMEFMASLYERKKIEMIRNMGNFLNS